MEVPGGYGGGGCRNQNLKARLPGMHTLLLCSRSSTVEDPTGTELATVDGHGARLPGMHTV